MGYKSPEQWYKISDMMKSLRESLKNLRRQTWFLPYQRQGRKNYRRRRKQAAPDAKQSRFARNGSRSFRKIRNVLQQRQKQARGTLDKRLRRKVRQYEELSFSGKKQTFNT